MGDVGDVGDAGNAGEADLKTESWCMVMVMEQYQFIRQRLPITSDTLVTGFSAA